MFIIISLILGSLYLFDISQSLEECGFYQTTDCVCENKCFCIKAFIEKSGYKTIVVQTTSHQILTPVSAR